mgnify:FL=1
MFRLEATPDTVHWGYFNRDLAPVIRVPAGALVEVETFSYPRGTDYPELLTAGLRRVLDEVSDVGPGPHLLTGPIYVEGVRPGDVLSVHIESIEPLLPVGFHEIREGAAGLGLLHGEFPNGHIRLMQLDLERRVVKFAQHIDVPMRTFFGIMGVAPPTAGRISSRAPGPFGGNLDLTALTAGATLYLPVFNEGGLFSVGDGHTAQGDGEVDLTAVETSLSGTLRFDIVKGFPIERPMAELPTHMISMGFHESLDEAVKIATRDMISWLTHTHGLTALEAYMLCSLVVDLRVTQVVNGRKGIHAMFPKSVISSTQG